MPPHDAIRLLLGLLRPRDGNDVFTMTSRVINERDDDSGIRDAERIERERWGCKKVMGNEMHAGE